jgi:hypothetical protein
LNYYKNNYIYNTNNYIKNSKNIYNTNNNIFYIKTLNYYKNNNIITQIIIYLIWILWIAVHSESIHSLQYLYYSAEYNNLYWKYL